MGPWEFSSIFRDVRTAHFWNLTPFEFWELDGRDQAFMIQYMMSDNEMKAYEDQLERRKLDSQSRQPAQGRSITPSPRMRS